jgi:hypothetical protein
MKIWGKTLIGQVVPEILLDQIEEITRQKVSKSKGNRDISLFPLI